MSHRVFNTNLKYSCPHYIHKIDVNLASRTFLTRFNDLLIVAYILSHPVVHADIADHFRQLFQFTVWLLWLLLLFVFFWAVCMPYSESCKFLCCHSTANESCS